MLRLQFLGPITIQKEDGSFDHTISKGSKRLSLLAYIVLAKPQGYHRRDELLALFWPDSGKKSARNSLSNLLYHIREALGKDIILNRGAEEICINSEKIWCDVLAFEQAIEQNEYKDAFQLYKSEFLSGFHVDNVSNDFQDWLDNQRKHLRDKCIDLCWKLTNRELEENNVDKAEQYALKAKELFPSSDKNQQEYIRFLVDIGKIVEARTAYRLYADQLEAEFGSDPPVKLQKYISKFEQKDAYQNNLDKIDNEKYRAKSLENKPNNRREQGIEKTSNEFNIDLIKSKPKRDSQFLIRYLLIFLFFLAGLWFINEFFFNSDSFPPTLDKSVAVLPFTNINEPDSIDYLSLGITEEILSKLARTSDLSVISRTSVMQYQNSTKSIREIARELGVSSVVEGSVQKHEDQVRITAQLIDAETDQHLWGDTFDRKFENILLVQSEVAARIADALQTELLPFENSDYAPNQDVDELAYQSYLQGKHLLDLHNPEGIVESVEIFKKSISIDSTFAPAHGGIALAYLYSGLLSRFDNDVTGVQGMDLRVAANLSIESSARALDINQNVVEAYLAQAIIYQRINKDWHRSEEQFLKALSLNSNHSDVRKEYGLHLLFQGNIDEALIHMEKAVSVDPLSWTAHHGLGYTYYCNREYDKAIRELETSINLGSRYPDTKKHLGLALLKRSQELFNMGRNDDAIRMIDRGSTILNEIWGTNTGWKETVVLAVMGNNLETIQSIKENPLPFPPMIYSLLLIGETDQALELLDNRLNFSINRTYVDPIFDSVRNHPRFKEMVEEDLGLVVEL